jgi:P4 family phage/plasmid primase-like protien
MTFSIEHADLTHDLLEYLTGPKTVDAIGAYLVSQMPPLVLDDATDRLLIKRHTLYWTEIDINDLASLVGLTAQVCVPDTLVALVAEQGTPQERKLFNDMVGFMHAKTSDPDNRRKVARSILDYIPRVNSHAAQAAFQSETGNGDPDFIWMLPTNQGFIDLRNGAVLRDNYSKDIISGCYITKDEIVVVPDVPDATDDEDEDEDTVNEVVQFFRQLFLGNPEHVRAVQMILGYCVTQDTRQQKLFVCYGSGSNGKSVLFNALRKLLGPTMTETGRSTIMKQTRINAAGPSPQLAKLQGKRIITVSETKSDDVIDEPLVKAATGGDKLVARGMYERREQEFSLVGHIVLYTNELPRINCTVSMLRRLVGMPFLAKFVAHPQGPNEFQMDRGLEARSLQPQFQRDLLDFIIRGAAMYYDYCVVHEQELPIPAEWQVQLRADLEDTDPMAQFFATLVTDAENRTTGGQLYTWYKQWCTQNNIRPLANNVFPARFQQIALVHGVRVTNVHGVKTYVGIGLPQ